MLQKRRKDRQPKEEVREALTNSAFVHQNVSRISAPTTIPINFLPQGSLYNFLQSKNNAQLISLVRDVIEKNAINNWIFINFFDPFFLQELPRDLKPAKTVYQCMDDISQVPYTAKHGLRLEEEIIRKYDLTICTSRELTSIKSKLSTSVDFLPNAVDYDLFKTAFEKTWNRPDDLPTGKKIIGYTGSLEYRSDIPLILRVAEYHSDKIIFIVGPVILPETETKQLAKFSNIVLAGPRRIEQLPAYLQYFDCGIIPFKKNTLTKSIYPLKINEYLAAGLPVISSDFSEDIKQFEDLIYLSSTPEEFIQNISAAISGDNEERRAARTKRASTNSWDARVEEFWSLVNIS